MKTIIFLNRTSYHRYNFSTIPQLSDYRLVAVVDREYFLKFPASQKAFFAEIYQVTDSKNWDTLDYVLDYSATSKIIEQEIASAGGSQNVTLICGDEHNVSILGKLRDQFQLQGAGDKKLQLFRDKTQMKERVLKHNIRAPAYTTFDKDAAKKSAEDYFHQLSQLFKLPFIIKPLNGVGGLYTYKIKNIDEFSRILPGILEQKISFEVEEFITGRLFHIDTVVKDKKILICICSENLNPLLAAQSGCLVGSLPLPDEWPSVQEMKQFSTHVLQAFDLIDGVAHMELFLTEHNELVFLEIGLRPPGGHVSDNYERMFAYNIYNHDLIIQLGLDAELSVPDKKTNSFFFEIPAKSGKCTHFPLPKIESTCELHWLLEAGAMIAKDAQSIFDAIAYGFVENSDFSALYQDFSKFRHFNPYSSKI